MKGMHGIIFSYEKKTGLRELIDHRIHGSIPIGGEYRMVDFMLSNMVNAGISDVGIIMQGKCQSMLDHLGTGKSWDLSRKRGGLTLLPAFAYMEGRGGPGKFRGKMEALSGVLNYLEEDIRQDYVVLADSDLMVNLPLDDVLEQHIATGADITCVCTAQAGEMGDTCFILDETGRIVDTMSDLQQPQGSAGLSIFVLSKELLIRLVRHCAAHNLYSLRRDVLQGMGKELHLHAYIWEGYAARINTIRGYYERSMELLDPQVRAQLFCPQRPIYAKENDAGSTYIDPTGVCVNSLIADGCDIQGSVRNSIIFRGVQVEKGAQVDGCILFKNTVVKKDAVLRNVIADKYVVFQEGRMLMGHEHYPMVLGRGSVV